MAYVTRALRNRNLDAENALKPCPDGCGHPWVGHRELDVVDPNYQPLHFHCSAAPSCGCVISAKVIP